MVYLGTGIATLQGDKQKNIVPVYHPVNRNLGLVEELGVYAGFSGIFGS